MGWWGGPAGGAWDRMWGDRRGTCGRSAVREPGLRKGPAAENEANKPPALKMSDKIGCGSGEGVGWRAAGARVKSGYMTQVVVWVWWVERYHVWRSPQGRTKMHNVDLGWGATGEPALERTMARRAGVKIGPLPHA